MCIATATSEHKLRGFTLLELVMVISILGIVGAVALPRMLESSDLNERGYANELASSLRIAQRIAAVSGCEVRFTIDAQHYSAMQRSSEANCRAKIGAWSTPVRTTEGGALSGSALNGVYISPTWVIVFDESGTIVGNLPSRFSIGDLTLAIDRSGTVTVQP
jgi:MSHA pilin protein MshC